MAYIKRTIKDIVEELLVQFPETRDSDFELYRRVVKMVCPEASRATFDEVYARPNDYGIPPFETVRRVRQKFQEVNPLLRASEAVTDMRYENWKEVRKFVQE